MYLSLKDERALAKEATTRLDDDRGLTQQAVAAHVELLSRPNPALYWLHRHSWDQLDRYARAVDRMRRPWFKGVVATYLALMVRRYGSERAAMRAHAAKTLPR